MKIYLSEFWVSEPADRHENYKNAVTLVSELKGQGFGIFYERQWRPYPQIEKEIEACDGLLALVDRYWTSSTWMAIELTHSAVAGLNSFIYYVPSDFYSAFPRGSKLPNTYVLPEDVGSAVNYVKALMHRG